jgi:hypothetical protein
MMVLSVVMGSVLSVVVGSVLSVVVIQPYERKQTGKQCQLKNSNIWVECSHVYITNIE